MPAGGNWAGCGGEARAVLWVAMPYLGQGRGSGGGGLHFRDPVDVFATEAARNTAFESGGTLEGEHVQFASDRSLAIVIGTLANPTSFQSYTGDAGGAYEEDAWLARTDFVTARGWSPELAAVSDGDRRVLQVHAWQGGSGTPPASGQYVGAAGLVDDIGDAVDVRASTPDGSVTRVKLAPDAGMPVYAGGVLTYAAASDTLTAAITGVATVTVPAIVIAFVPAGIDRKNEPLTLDVGNLAFPLRTLTGASVRARDLTPGQLLQVVSGSRHTLLEPLQPRPQDFVIHMFIFTPTNSDDTGPPDFADPEHTLTQAILDAATYHTMSASATSPRVAQPTGYAPTRTVSSDADEAYDDYFAFWEYYAVPADAPDIRGIGGGTAAAAFGETEARGWRGGLATITAARRVAGTFDIGGVAHKFVRLDNGIEPDFEANDPPTTWEDNDTGEPYRVLAFDGLPDPPITT